jgi:hypothetical protein
MKRLRHFQIFFILFFLASVSAFSCLYFFSNGQHLLYGDALSRLDISRKIIDNLTPGLAQMGNVWLPLPQLFMLPLIWNSYLWHSGIAGAAVSMTAFILGGIFLFKSAQLITKSFISSLFALSIYALNINLLYLQTTAMSEPLFLCAINAGIFFFLLWITSKNNFYLIPAGLAVSAMTLIRYEALAILFSSIPLVFFYLWFTSKKYHKAEGVTFLYAVLACLGFSLWTLYLTVIFGDPLYWKNYYADTPAEVTNQAFVHQLSFLDAGWKYLTSVVWMNGLIPTVLALLAIPVVVITSLRKKSFYFLPLLFALSLFAFMILTLQRNTPIEQPQLTVENILSPVTSKMTEFNIRYGLSLLPFIVLLCSWLFAVRFLAIKILLFALLFVQFYSYYHPSYSVIYQLPISIRESPGPGGERARLYMEWLKAHYNGGRILISAQKHDPQMFQLGYEYKTYIHEGTGNYWLEARKDPRKYAKWVVMDYINNEDKVTKVLKDSPVLEDDYHLVYNEQDIRIYKKKL